MLEAEESPTKVGANAASLVYSSGFISWLRPSTGVPVSIGCDTGGRVWLVPADPFHGAFAP